MKSARNYFKPPVHFSVPYSREISFPKVFTIADPNKVKDTRGFCYSDILVLFHNFCIYLHVCILSVMEKKKKQSSVASFNEHGFQSHRNVIVYFYLMDPSREVEHFPGIAMIMSNIFQNFTSYYRLVSVRFVN